jgi:hypothetical protein
METSWPRADALKLRKGLVVFRASEVVADRSGQTPSDRTRLAGQCWVERAGVAAMKPCLATVYANGPGGKQLSVFFEGFFLRRAADLTKEKLDARR